MEQPIRYTTDLADIDWARLKAALAADRFDNGRTGDELRRAFENSYAACFALAGGRVVGKARALSDGVSNAYLVDVWTLSSLRRRGIGSRMVRLLLERLTGQHVYLFTDDAVEFYQQLGFREQPQGLGLVVGRWLQRGD